MWTWRRCAEALVLVLAAGCNDAGSGAEFGPFDIGPGPADAGTDGPVCGPGEVLEGGICRSLPPDVCAYVDQLDFACADLDGDCFVACDKAPAALRDCDDTRADVRPLGEELCDGLDNDCDGSVDEGYAVGHPCEACGLGKVECAVDDARQTACSTAAGQSEAPPPVTEACNGLDDDCDGRVDEACTLDLPPAPRRHVRLCGGDLVVVEAAALVRRRGLIGEAEILDAGPVAAVACEGATIAWIKPGEAPCAAPDGEALRCPGARLFVQIDGENTRDLTGLADLGYPAVADGAVLWHTVLGSGPVLQRWTADGGIEPLLEGGAASDPTPPVAGRVALRDWEASQPRVAVVGLDGNRDVRVDTPPAPAGPPALDAAWAAWVLEGANPAVWAVPLDQPRMGFQVTVGGAPRGRPWLDGGALYWLDTDGLRRFDLATGRLSLAVPGAFEADELDVRAGHLVWIEGEAVRLEGFVPPAPEAPPEVPPEAEPTDAP